MLVSVPTVSTSASAAISMAMAAVTAVIILTALSWGRANAFSSSPPKGTWVQLSGLANRNIGCPIKLEV